MPTFHLPTKWFRPRVASLAVEAPNSMRAPSVSGRVVLCPSRKTISAGSLNSMRATSATAKLCRCPSGKTMVTLRPSFELIDEEEAEELEAEFCPRLAVEIISANVPTKIVFEVLSMSPPRKRKICINDARYSYTKLEPGKFHASFGPNPDDQRYCLFSRKSPSN